ncbi:DegT/DnrJ/EryC1/StrS family aminotransferase [Roseateles sp. BYS87W]|uniref:DegT/DnrJ/EryC1/StrS family aminotransferase n=1 Tax=Pelomonas baiyunensis TaxID=3299026 RepID=A0ABW7GYB4_9BURK
MSSDTPTRQPTRPVFGWDNLRGPRATSLPAVDALPHRQVLTSGRAAIGAAVQVLGLRPGDGVLAPSYHCPTLVAPLRAAGSAVQYYPLNAQGLPELSGLQPAPGTRALLAAQLFGLPQSFAGVRAWCDAHGLALIEDCAHSFFGQAGERPVGHWGDVATASLTKFFPVSEAGLLASAQPFAPMPLAPAGARQQVKAGVDLLERGAQHRRLPGLHMGLDALFRLKNGPRAATAAPVAAHASPAALTPPAAAEAAMLAACDMSRTGQSVTALDRALLRLPRGRIVSARRAHFNQLLQAGNALTHARPLWPVLPDGAAPYALPLWVADADRADAAYAALRAAGCAVFRWDHTWPGCPALPGDAGTAWRRELLQLLCHQDLTATELAHTAAQLQRLL